MKNKPESLEASAKVFADAVSANGGKAVNHGTFVELPNGLPKPDCDHLPLSKAIRKGRAHYVCHKCGQDITFMLVLIAEAEAESKRLRCRPRKKISPV